jgi:type III pantothenate kinase
MLEYKIKGAVFEEATALEYFVLSQGTGKKILEILKKYQSESSCCGLGWDGGKNSLLVFENSVKVHFVSHNDLFPFVNR